MNITVRENKRHQTRGEEIANSLCHWVGFFAALGAAPFLISKAALTDNFLILVGSVVFILAVLFLYFSSAFYHALPLGRLKQFCKNLDHTAIFFLIAGCYTPFILGSLRGTLGWMVLGMVWGLACYGIFAVFVSRLHHPRFFLILYLLMGWLALMLIHVILERIPIAGILLLLAGGLSYTGGVPFFLADHIRYGHVIWHSAVLMGTLFHFIAIYRYAF